MAPDRIGPEILAILRRRDVVATATTCYLVDNATTTLTEERAVKLEGIHHITAITGDAPRNVEFYAGTLGLRMVKKTVNQDDPTVYHLFYADEQGSPGADLTFFEYPGAAQGRPGPGQVHRIVWRVGSPDGDRLLGQAARGARLRVRARRRRAALRRPRGPRPRAAGVRRPRRPADRRASRDPARARAAGLRRRARLRDRPRPQRGAAARDARLHGRRGRALGGPRRPARRLLRLRPRPGRPPLAGRRQRPPHRVRDADGRAGRLARARRRAPATPTRRR